LPQDFSATELLTDRPIRAGCVTVPARQAIVVRLDALVVEQRPEPVPAQPDPSATQVPVRSGAEALPEDSGLGSIPNGRSSEHPMAPARTVDLIAAP
jgi:hypothetical protein